PFGAGAQQARRLATATPTKKEHSRRPSRNQQPAARLRNYHPERICRVDLALRRRNIEAETPLHSELVSNAGPLVWRQRVIKKDNLANIAIPISGQSIPSI